MPVRGLLQQGQAVGQEELSSRTRRLGHHGLTGGGAQAEARASRGTSLRDLRPALPWSRRQASRSRSTMVAAGADPAPRHTGWRRRRSSGVDGPRHVRAAPEVRGQRGRLLLGQRDRWVRVVGERSQIGVTGGQEDRVAIGEGCPQA